MTAKNTKNAKNLNHESIRTMNFTRLQAGRTFCLLFALLAIKAAAGTLYVDLNSANPVAPYDDWSRAATNIQDAVDAAGTGDLILVNDGVYQTGGRVVSGALTNRLAVTKPVNVRSVNGPGVTIIKGSQVPGTTNGDSAVRCAYLASGAWLVGFTLTNGATRTAGSLALEGSGGGVWCETSAVLSNCVLSGNAAYYCGGGAAGGTLNNCTLTGNSTFGTSYDCNGGGANNSTLNSCIVSGNRAGCQGGGAAGGTLNNCALTDNRAGGGGGGAYHNTLNNCTLTGNSAAADGGGAYSTTLNNCIIYYNSSGLTGPNSSYSTLSYCCTAPPASGGLGNIAAEPGLAGPYRLSANSPCLNAGAAYYASGTDIDGEPWASPPSMGCDEFNAAGAIGSISVSIRTSYASVATGFSQTFFEEMEGKVNASRWEFGDGTIVSNQPVVSHAWSVPGDYLVVLRAYNADNPSGVIATAPVHVTQPVLYVALDSPAPQVPYNSWTTAATNIQDAVDAASVPGTLVLVSNGIYQTGGRVVYGALTNRVAVTNAITVRSLNGPAVTVIQGYQVPGTTNGDAAIRCVYLTTGATLSGFTLANGATRQTGNMNNEQSGGGVCTPSAAGVISNCVLINNSAQTRGGGAYSGTLIDCLVLSNSCWGGYGSSGGGGAAYSATLSNCAVIGNWSFWGGGVLNSTLSGCVLSSNTVMRWDGAGGGAYGSTLYNCTVAGNRAESFVNGGGGVCYCTLNNCTLTGNSTGGSGGGAWNSTLNNCTVVGNSASLGGGARWGYLNNCIVYYNTAPCDANYTDITLNYCCTTPLPSGPGNISSDPQLASGSHLSAESPCRGAGSPDYATGLDLDGETWGNPPSIGCDEYWSGTRTGAVSVAIAVPYTNVAVGFGVSLGALINGQLSASRWDYGDGVVVSNRPSSSHVWNAPGDYLVELRAYNETYPAGVAATVTVRVAAQPVHYVALSGLSPTPPYSSWATAATNIQDAVDATTLPGALVLVSNGVYETGARAVYGMSNRLAVTKPVTVRGFNGPAITTIRGYQVPGTTYGGDAVRCVYLTNGAVLAGLTLTNGGTQSAGDSAMQQSGGGVWAESASAVVSNCVLAGNSASIYGGGAYGGLLINCRLTGNSSAGTGRWTAPSGGGAYFCTLNNCTLAGNSATSGGGGACYSDLNNCIAYFNLGGMGPNYLYGSFNYCCTTPLPSGDGNFTNEPLFFDTNNWGNLRLQSTSPCINAGLNAYVAGATDLDGRARIVGGTVDTGAYEFQGPGMSEFIGWLQQYALPMDGAADTADSDHDGVNNWQEWRAGTDPTNALSVLQMVSPTNGPSGVTVTWQSVTNRSYYLQRSLDLSAQPPFVNVQSNIVGQAGTTSYTDTNAAGAGPFFYRVGVQ